MREGRERARVSRTREPPAITKYFYSTTASYLLYPTYYLLLPTYYLQPPTPTTTRD